MKRTFLHSKITHRRPYDSHETYTDAVIYYDDYTVREFDGYITNLVSFVAYRIMGAEDYKPTDEIILYSDTFTKEKVDEYAKKERAELESPDALRTYTEPGLVYKREHCECIEEAAKLFNVFPFSACPDEPMKKRMEKIEREFTREKVNPYATPDLYFKGTRRLYEDTILAEN